MRDVSAKPRPMTQNYPDRSPSITPTLKSNESAAVLGTLSHSPVKDPSTPGATQELLELKQLEQAHLLKLHKVTSKTIKSSPSQPPTTFQPPYATTDTSIPGDKVCKISQSGNNNL